MTRFSIIHPSARPDRAFVVGMDWIDKAYGVTTIEYIPCFDMDAEIYLPETDREWIDDNAILKVTRNTARKCSVDATNTGAAAASGDLMIVISDDITAEQDWDLNLWRIFVNHQADNGKQPLVIAVDTMDQEDPTHTLTVQILNRARYEQLGYIFHPDYTSMYADDEFTRHAKRDGVLQEALHIKMKHERFERDEVYERQQGAARFAWGEALLRHREKHGFPRVTPGLASMREVVNIWNLGEWRITGDVSRAIAALEGK